MSFMYAYEETHAIKIHFMTLFTKSNLKGLLSNNQILKNFKL